MPCYYPLHGYRAKHKETSGKRRIVFNPRDGIIDQEVSVPCGQCIGCKLERSKQWAIRCVHEASLYEQNCFITLTYAPEHLPENASLVKKDYQNFMKRLRRKLGKVRYYMCGEYGEQCGKCGNNKGWHEDNPHQCTWLPRIGRPHFHACLFGHDFQDKELIGTPNGIPLYKSEILKNIWQKGHVAVGSVTFESAAYIARYVTKKINGPKENEVCPTTGLKHYERQTETGEIVKVEKEYTNMSRNPGIGKDWFMYYHNDVFEHDSVIIRGKEIKPPRYYTELYKDIDEVGYELVKEKRREKGLRNQSENDIDRLRAREKVKLAQTKTLTRELT